MATRLASSNLSNPPDTYLFQLAQAHGTPTLATIGSDNTLRLFTADLRLQHTQPHTHRGPGGGCVTTLTTGSPTHYVTGGSDGAVRCWDARSGAGVAEFHDPSGPSSSGIAALAVHDTYIAAGTASAKEGLGDVSVLLFDTRKPRGGPVREYTDSHTDTITQLSFHPRAPHCLLSGSTDGLVSVFDTRVVEEDDALLQVLNPRGAVHASGWMPGGEGREVFVLTMDEQFAVHMLPEDWATPTTEEREEEAEGPGDAPRDFGDVRAALGCMYVVGVCVQEEGPPLMVAGHTERQMLGIVGLQGGPGKWEFGPRVELPGAHGEEVVRDLLVVDGGRRAYSCGEDGKVVAWGLGS